MFLRFQQGSASYSSFFMRIWNEGATLLLFAIIFLIILRDSIQWWVGIGALLGLMAVLMLGIRMYKKTQGK